MKTPMINYSINGAYDELYTPSNAVYPIIPYLPKDFVYWECTDSGNSNITKILRSNNLQVISSHKETGFDFLKDVPEFSYDCVITNPPYSLKNQFLEHCYLNNIPFVMLLPLTTLESKFRGSLFSKYGVSVIVLDKRVDFTGKRSCWFNVSWFLWQIPLKNNLVFESVEGEPRV